MLTAPFRLRPIVCFCLMALPALARAQTAPGALPTNGTVASGSVTLHQDANTLRVNQASDKAIVNWQTFNIGRDAAVQFVQPGAGSAILNRVASGPSDIAGKLTSNGRVYLVNPNGVLFGASARVDVGSLVVAAGTVSDSSFLSGAPQVASRGGVANAGTLNTADGGSVVLAGSSVANSGSINAPHGAITLAAGDAVRINLSDDGLIQAQVTLAAPHALVTNSGAIASEGGRIALAASASAGGAGGLVIDSGIVRAGAVRTQGGTVSLIGGEVQASGSIDVSSAEGAAGSVAIFGDLQAGSVRLDGSIDARGATAGGMVETSAARVQAGPAARVATLASNGDHHGDHGRHGTWLIDPQDYTIGNAPGDDISGASLSANLNQGNVTIESVTGARSGAGDIHVNAPVSWGADTTLTLTAENSILFASGAITDPRNPNGAAQANLTATGDNAGLVMNFRTDYNLGENKLTLSGATPHVTMNGVQFTVINSLAPEALNTTARNNLGGNYVLTSDIDASETGGDNAGLGWEPLGNNETPFSGQLHGFGHVIGNLAINRPDTNNVGLFGVLSGTVRDIGLLDPDIVGGYDTGALAGSVGYSDRAQVRHAWVAGGRVSGDRAGGLVGLMADASFGSGPVLVDSSYTSGVAVTSSNEGTGLIGEANFYGTGGIGNSFYNAGDPLYGDSALGPGAIAASQFASWLANGRSLRIADYSASLPFDPQTGTYGLSSVQGMTDLLGFVNAGVKLRLTGDIDLAGSPGLFLPTFNGELDGANHKVSNLVLDSTDRVFFAGLVGVNTGSIRNINVVNTSIDGDVVGGIAGVNLGTIQNSSVGGTVRGTGVVGGLVGYQLGNGALHDSVSTADVTGDFNPGGVVGYFVSGSLRNTHYNADAVRINGSTAGVTAGALHGAQYADWIANGRRLDIAQYSSVLPRDPASGAYLVSSVAGMDAMLGFVDDPALGFRLTADIDLAPVPGFYLPYLAGTLDGNGHRISHLKLDMPRQEFAGLVGQNFGTVRNLGVTDVDVVGAYYAGGLVGWNDSGAHVETSFSSGKVSALAGAGGLVGLNFGDIGNSYSSASVAPVAVGDGGIQDYQAVGGLVGENYGSISNSLATGAVASGGGGLVGTYGQGNSGGSVTNSFWNTETSGAATSNGGTGKTTAELQSAATYTGWDFTTVWTISNGSPALRTFAGEVPAPEVPPPVTPDPVTPDPGGPIAPDGPPVPVQSLALSPASLVLPRVPDASAGGSVALAANLAGGATPQRKELFLQAGDAITRDPNIGTLKNCGEDQLGDCIAKPRTSYKAQVLEDTGAAAPAMHIKRKLALVIGNNDYHSPLSRLEGAGRDADAVAALLQQQGYQVDHLADANRSSMITSLNRLIRTAEPDDSVLVFYAGHGYIHPGSSVGYWIPTSADVDDPRGWISNIDIARFLANIPARQLLLVSDSCFSGALTREGVAEEQRTGLNRNAILMRRSVVALSSGGEEVVADSTLDGHSPFTYYLLRQLQQAKGEIPARDMLLSIRDKVTSNAGQVPSYGIIISSGHASGGEYLLNPKSN